jgi:hypothetical protein
MCEIRKGILVGVRDVAGHGCETKEGVRWKGNLWNEEAIGPIIP